MDLVLCFSGDNDELLAAFSVGLVGLALPLEQMNYIIEHYQFTQ